MDFFKQLFDTGEVDLTLRIMKKNDKLTINLMPGSKVSTAQPIILTGTPEELDTEFFPAIMPKVGEIKGLVTNLEEVKAETKKKAEERKNTPTKKATKEVAKKKATKKADKKPAKKKAEEKPPMQEGVLFPPPAEQNKD